jgi:hypothetical protein
LQDGRIKYSSLFALRIAFGFLTPDDFYKIVAPLSLDAKFFLFDKSEANSFLLSFCLITGFWYHVLYIDKRL